MKIVFNLECYCIAKSATLYGRCYYTEVFLFYSCNYQQLRRIPFKGIIANNECLSVDELIIEPATDLLLK